MPRSERPPQLTFEIAAVLRQELSLGLYLHDTPDSVRVEALMRALTDFVDSRVRVINSGVEPPARRELRTVPPDSLVEVAYAEWLRAKERDLVDGRECVRRALAVALQRWLEELAP